MHTGRLPLPPPNLPILYPEETLYSWCAQVHAWNGNPSVLNTSKQLFGSPYSGLLHDFPANLKVLHEKTFGLLPDSIDLALNHTLLGYYLPFHEKTASFKILKGVINGSVPQLKFLLGIPASRVGGDHPLKLCPECIKMNLQEYGRPVWQVSQQRPSSFLCTVHHRPLHFIQTNNTPVHQRFWINPSSNNKTLILKIQSDILFERLNKLSEFSDFSHKMPAGSLDLQILARTYQYQLLKVGLLTKRGSIKIKALCLAVTDYYKNTENLPGFHILQSLNNSTSGFVGSITRKQPKKAHPFKHLLLMSMLFESWGDLINCYNKVEQKTPEWILPPIKQQKIEDPRIAPFIHMIDKEKRPIHVAAKRAGISVTTGTQWAKQHGINFTPRPKHLTPDKLKQIRGLIEKGKLKKEIVTATGISLVSVNRILAANANLKSSWDSARFNIDRVTYRNAFLKVVKDNPNLLVKKIRKIPGNGYAWLYRHDRDWLIDHLPSLWNHKPN